MFGYVRPYRPELRCKDLDLYQATYCGLCRTLRSRYGLLAPMFLNFDLTFLALLLWEPEESFTPCKGRCHGAPLVKKPMCPESPALDLAADENIVLTWWKLQDSIRDDGFWGGLPARGLSLLMRRSYRKAAERCPDFDRAVRASLEELEQLEQQRSPSIDRTADAFARLLQAAAPAGAQNERVLRQLLYHLGRWIYLVDARDDLEEDKKAGRYNPLVLRYGPQGDDRALALTLGSSLDQMGAALQLGDFGCRAPLLENIIYWGIPQVQRAVLDGNWSQLKNKRFGVGKHERSL